MFKWNCFFVVAKKLVEDDSTEPGNEPSTLGRSKALAQVAERRWERMERRVTG